MEVDVAQLIAWKFTVREDLSLIPSSEDGLLCKKIWGWLFLDIHISLLSDNVHFSILTYNKNVTLSVCVIIVLIAFISNF